MYRLGLEQGGGKGGGGDEYANEITYDVKKFPHFEKIIQQIHCKLCALQHFVKPNSKIGMQN